MVTLRFWSNINLSIDKRHRGMLKCEKRVLYQSACIWKKEKDEGEDI